MKLKSCFPKLLKKEIVNCSTEEPKKEPDKLLSKLREFSKLQTRKDEAFSLFSSIALSDKINSTEIEKIKVYVDNMHNLEDVENFIFQLTVYKMGRSFDCDFDEQLYLNEMLSEERPEEERYFFDYLYDNRNSEIIMKHLQYMVKEHPDKYNKYLAYLRITNKSY